MFVAADFPVPELREYPGMTSKRGRIGTNGRTEKRGSRRIPCIFPAHQGFRHRDGFAPDCLHRHSVCSSRRLSGWSAIHPPKPRGCARFWARGPGEPEAETAGFGRGRRCRWPLSPLPSWAVRIRSRFAPAKGSTQEIQQHPHGSRMVRDLVAQNESVSRNWVGELSASGR